MKRLCMLLAALLLAGCSTPAPVLQHAANGVSMTVGLQESIADFRRAQARIAQGRVDSVRRQEALMARYDADAAFDVRIEQAAGRTARANLFKELRELSDSRVKDAADLAAALAALDEKMAKLVSPLPEVSGKLEGVQKTMAAMSEELSAKDRIKEAVDFGRTLRKQVEANKEKAEQAAGEARTAPVQAPPAK